MEDYIVFKNITKIFNKFKALDSVSLTIKQGEVHALVGENGAGKSTLMKVLGGVHTAEQGEMYLDGKKVSFKNIHEAQNAGVAIIFQELNLMPDLTVAENIFLGRLPGKRGILEKRKMVEDAQNLLDSMNLKLNPKAYISDLTVAQCQMVEILKSVSRNCNVIIMDEPTAPLNDKEVEILYDTIALLKKQGRTILYVSHRMKEIFDLADTVSVLRDGKHIITDSIKNLDEKKLVTYMVGRDAEAFYSKECYKTDDIVLEVKGLTSGKEFNDISFNLKKGEILGFAGLMGCGKEEALKTVYGVHSLEKGEVSINGTKLNKLSPATSKKSGIQFVTEDRKGAGILGQVSVKENTSFNVLDDMKNGKFGFISGNKENELLKKYTEYLDMKYSSPDQELRSLSGGNQQKVLLARAIAGKTDVIILLEPTRGIDVNVKAEIYGLLQQLAKKGVGIIVSSSELPEIIAISDRVIVMHQGKITGNLTGDDINEIKIMNCATGIEVAV